MRKPLTLQQNTISGTIDTKVKKENQSMPTDGGGDLLSKRKGRWHGFECLEVDTVLFEAKDGVCVPLVEEDIKKLGNQRDESYGEGELTQVSTVKDYLTVQTEGGRTVKRRLRYYNLDVISRSC